MRILITGANGYIGRRLITVLLERGHTVFACVRSRARFALAGLVEVLEIDFEQEQPGAGFPQDIDVAYYLIHSMDQKGDFATRETATAVRFMEYVHRTRCRQIVYLGGIVNEETLSPHLRSRLEVEAVLRKGSIPLTVLRAGIIVGSGSASFEIIRDLVEKLPVMVAPRWLNTLCQPIGIRNVLFFLAGVALREDTYGQDFDIGGPEVLTYKQMLLQYAAVRGLRRIILTLPVMTPRLSSYWLYFITSVPYPLAVNLVDSMKVNVICRPNQLAAELQITLLTYKEAVAMAFQKIEQNEVVSSWKDAFSASRAPAGLMQYLEVPTHGCFRDQQVAAVGERTSQILERVWSIGGMRGWYYGNSLWRLRGFLDKVVGGVGLRRGRTHTLLVHPGDALDFWRVLVADREQGRLLLFAEMRLPGDAWLEFKIVSENGKDQLCQTATFRPRGLWGRLYWYSMLPFHYFIFAGMIHKITQQDA